MSGIRGRPPVGSDKKAFLDALEALGNSAGNISLKQKLDWNADKYWRIQGLLYEAGEISKGRGKGGSVTLVEAEKPTTNLEEKRFEKDLYKPARDVIDGPWAKSNTLERRLVEVTAYQGRRDTGGKWSRPDVTAIVWRSFAYIPDKYLDVYTFEIKPDDSVGVEVIYEALSHKQAATYSYVVYHTTLEKFEKHRQYERIVAAVKSNGIGVILAEEMDNFDKWEEFLDAERSVYNPAWGCRRGIGGN